MVHHSIIIPHHFDSWPGPVINNIGDWTVQPNVTDASSGGSSTEDDVLSIDPQPSEEQNVSLQTEPLVISSDDDGITPAQHQQSTRTRGIKPATAALLSELFSDSSIDEPVHCQVDLPSTSKGNKEISKSLGARPKISGVRKKNKRITFVTQQALNQPKWKVIPENHEKRRQKILTANLTICRGYLPMMIFSVGNCLSSHMLHT